MTLILHRPSLDSRSGAGQLLVTQHRALAAVGEAPVIACARGALKFWLRTGVRPRRWSVERLQRLQQQGALLIDHGLTLPSADLVFVHNVAGEVQRHLPDVDLGAQARREQQFFAELSPRAGVVANSRLVARVLEASFGLAPERVTVLHPGYASARFNRDATARLRAPARAALAIAEHTPLVGLVTSGHFAKRGLDTFLDCAAKIAAVRPDVRFLLVGSKDLPAAARAHPLVATGAVHYRAKGPRPEQWLAALDLLLYPAVFEEYGLVVAEAEAMGLPIVTSRLVGASECLPPPYAAWLLDRPEPAQFAAHVLTMLADRTLRQRLATAGADHAPTFDERAYGAGTIRLVEAQKRRLR